MLTAVIITKNEEKNIGRCLESLKGIVEDIVIVDSHSTDQTQAIVKAHNARFVCHDWLGYSQTKNYANGLAQSEYILSMDADEALSPELRSSILEAKQNLNGIYCFNRKTNYCGQWINHCGWYPDTKVRIFPKSAVTWNNNTVHEDLTLPAGTGSTFLKGDLHHYSYYTVSEHLERTNHYAQLAAKSIAKKGKKLLLLRAVFNSGFRFFKNYFIKLGFLDGYYGLVISLVSSREVYRKYRSAHRIQSLKS